MRPVLRPGLQILRRDLRTVQLGHDWPGLAALPDSVALQAVLEAIDGFRDLDGVAHAAASRPDVALDESRAALSLLVESGAVVDRVRTETHISHQRQRAAWWLLGLDAAEVADERAGCQVWVEDWGDNDATVAELARPLISRSGLAVAADRASADVVLAASDDVPDRSRSDDLVRCDVPHVWAYLRDLVGVIGPCVVPGRSACLRCTDAAAAERDATWPTVLAACAARPRASGPCDPVLATVVAAWAVQEIAIWASGLTPATYDAVIEVPLGLASATTRTHCLHPQCGCGWQMRHDTIGA